MAQPTGDTPSQMQRGYADIHGPQLERNPEGGYCSVVSNEERLKRYLLLGVETELTNRENAEKEEEEELKTIDELLQDMEDNGEGGKLLQIIKEISERQQNLRQDQLLHALAFSCYSEKLRKEAYKILNHVCRTPTHLFIFLEKCRYLNDGWCKAKKEAIANWYKQFEDRAEELAMLVTKYKKRQGWTHRDVLRLAHVKCGSDTPRVAFILSYIVKGIKRASEMHTIDKLNGLKTKLRMYDGAKRIETHEDDDKREKERKVQELSVLIQENRLCWEHISTTMLNETAVWEALLPSMPIEAMLRNLGKMTKLNVFAKKENIRRVEEKLRDSEKIHPFRVFITFMQYQKGRPEDQKKLYNANTGWVIEEGIEKALEKAFHEITGRKESTQRQFCLAVDVSISMREKVQSKLSAMEVALAMALMTYTTEDGILVGFSKEVVKFKVPPKQEFKIGDIDKVANNFKDLQQGKPGTDCVAPFKWALENKKQFDVFVIYTDNYTWSGNMHVMDALKQYRQWRSQNVKLVVCSVSSTAFSITSGKDANILLINAFDPLAPEAIQRFVRGE